MKKLGFGKAMVMAPAVALLASSVSAGGLAPAVIETEVMVVEQTGSGFGWLIPLLIVGILVAVASGEESQTTSF